MKYPPDAKSTVEGLRARLRGLFRDRRTAVLCTRGPVRPYRCVVGFAASPDLEYLLFTTARTTRKYGNLCCEPRASLSVDTLEQHPGSQNAMAATALGVAREVSREPGSPYLGQFLEKHPNLRPFSKLPTCALFRLEVEKYCIVSPIGEATEWTPK
jgi:hypothetical protein